MSLLSGPLSDTDDKCDKLFPFLLSSTHARVLERDLPPDAPRCAVPGRDKDPSPSAQLDMNIKSQNTDDQDKIQKA